MYRGQSQGKRKREEEESPEGASTSSSKRANEENTERASTSSTISPEATGADNAQYDVFLSFNGSDTRRKFTDHLYQNLVDKGIGTFRDDKNIPPGMEFGSQIFNAISQSRISIPIISENYASKEWCLRELAYIMHHKKNTSHIVLPIFYEVTPSDVRHVRGNFGEAFCSSREHFDEKDIQKWQRALKEVSYLEGWESQKFANGQEGELIRAVVKTVISKLKRFFLQDVPKQLVGLDDHVKEIVNQIDCSSTNARMIGIYGMGGIGKTTLAKCIFNQLSNKFDCVSFLPDVREIARRHGIAHIQDKLIGDILKYKNEVSSFHEGINTIKSRFKGKKVLIVLDNIDHNEQLDALAREPNWFGEGSLIIVTTRNKAVLDKSEFEVDYMYKLNGLDEGQSLLLFNRHAFHRDHSPQDFKSISHDIVSTMGGLPLALKVVGSSLYKEMDRKVWEEVWKRLKSQPCEEVEEALRISYDALKDEHKKIFLDIACFFIGKEIKFAMYMWEDCGFSPHLGVKELELRCLINIGVYGVFEMHDQLRDLGRRIFCKGKLLENHSGPWDDGYEGVPRVLRQHECRRRFHDLMRAASNGDEDLSDVRWLQWKINESGSSLSTVNLRLPKLAVLDLRGSKITEDWKGWSSFRASTRLRALNLAVCANLRSTPDLSAFTQLKTLVLHGCSKLEHLHPSIGELKSLISLSFRLCRSLKELPEEVGKLKDLEELDLRDSGITHIPTSIRSLGKLKKLDASGCMFLKGIRSSTGDLQNLQHLNLCCSGIEELPSAIGRLKNLQALDIFCTSLCPVSISMKNLQSLDLHCCDKLRSVPKLPLMLGHLTRLNLRNFSARSPVISDQILRLPLLCNLILLQELDLRECHSISDHPSGFWKLDGFRNLKSFSISKCSSIEILDLSELVHLKELDTRHCNNLVEIQGLDNLEFLEHIIIIGCASIKKLCCPKSRCLKELNVQICNNLVEIQGPLDGAKSMEWLSIGNCKSLETFLI